jgi:predicted nucleotidyltransferase
MDEEKIVKDFEFLKDDVEAIILFGSYTRNEQTSRSDIDVCVVCGNKKEKIEKVWDKILESGITEKYDVKIFELLPLKMKISVIKEGKVLYAKNEIELSYYFRFFRKLWEDEVIAKSKLGINLEV